MVDQNINKRFNSLAVIEKTEFIYESENLYQLECDCGNTVYQRISQLELGHLKSCQDCFLKDE